MMIRMNAQPVLLATTDGDIGLVPVGKALKQALDLARELGVAVTLRDPVTDKIIASVKPGN
jgi:hypothetical protein